jgi:hypothetical protein
MEYEAVFKALNDQLLAKDSELYTEKLLHGHDARKAAERIERLEDDVCALNAKVAALAEELMNARAASDARRIMAAEVATVADDDMESYQRHLQQIVAQDETAIEVEGV